MLMIPMGAFETGSASEYPALRRSYQICHLLFEEGLLTAGQVSVALYDQHHTGLSLEEILVLHGWISRDIFHRTLLRKVRVQLTKLAHVSRTSDSYEQTLVAAN
ncbi:hypothetical protein C7271_15040 [filamentous cyanobacterium CCP5]|nr:hypothetical protein C7271_15040 [filamentous cyanobacterium CCP5]